MAKYRKASEGSKKGISTDKLSLADAREYFQGRAKETGAKRFRWNGEVYDLSGNKVSEAPARSSGGNSSRSSEGPQRPKANPTRQPGGARPEPGKAAGMPAAKGKTESPGKRREANPLAVAGMSAAGVGAGVAAARSGRGGVKTSGGGSASTGRNAPKPTPAGPKPSATSTPSRIRPASKPSARPSSKPAASGARAGGSGGGFGQPNVFEKALNPLNLYKGGMVKKK